MLITVYTGSGKSTLSRTVARKLPNFHRITFDGIIASRHGIYGVDYEKSEHEMYADEADNIFYETADQLMSEGKDVILDRAFYAKEDRDHYRALAEKHGGRVVLVYLSAPKEVHWQRIVARREASVNADSMFEISRELLDMYYDGFEVPSGEGEIVVDTTKLSEETEMK